MDARENTRKKLYDLLMTHFPTEYGSALPIKFENQTLEQPLAAPFLAPYLMFTRSYRASVGTTKIFVEHEGFFCIEAQVPETTGMSVLWRIVGACERALREQQTTLDDGSYISLKTSKVVGNTSQDGWYFCTVMIPFCVYECLG